MAEEKIYDITIIGGGPVGLGPPLCRPTWYDCEYYREFVRAWWSACHSLPRKENL